jgi:hypothetical protein
MRMPAWYRNLPLCLLLRGRLEITSCANCATTGFRPAMRQTAPSGRDFGFQGQGAVVPGTT